MEGSGILPLLVVGSGPHSLALISKLLEPYVDLYEEVPWNDNLFKRTSNKISARFDKDPPRKLIMLDKDMRRLRNDSAKREREHAEMLAKMRIVDRHGEWLAQWDRQFGALAIGHLRSSMGAHICPCDPQALRLWAEDTKRRESDMLDISLDRDDLYHGPYEVPSTPGFRDFTEDIVRRYHLQSKVERASVISVRSCDDPSATADGDAEPCFEVVLQSVDGKEERVVAHACVHVDAHVHTHAFRHVYAHVYACTYVRTPHIYTRVYA